MGSCWILLTLRSVLAISILACLLVTAALPSAHAGYATVLVGGRRPSYSPEFTGLIIATVSYVVLAPGLYMYLRMAAPLARQPLILIAVSPLPKPVFWFSRWVADVIVLCILMVVLAVSGCVLVWQRGEASVSQAIWQLFVPLSL